MPSITDSANPKSSIGVRRGTSSFVDGHQVLRITRRNQFSTRNEARKSMWRPTPVPNQDQQQLSDLGGSSRVRRANNATIGDVGPRVPAVAAAHTMKGPVSYSARNRPSNRRRTTATHSQPTIARHHLQPAGCSWCSTALSSCPAPAQCCPACIIIDQREVSHRGNSRQPRNNSNVRQATHYRVNYCLDGTWDEEFLWGMFDAIVVTVKLIVF